MTSQQQINATVALGNAAGICQGLQLALHEGVIHHENLRLPEGVQPDDIRMWFLEHLAHVVEDVGKVQSTIINMHFSEMPKLSLAARDKIETNRRRRA
jgi:hypothetical protein